jgi:hypothetical protein
VGRKPSDKFFCHYLHKDRIYLMVYKVINLQEIEDEGEIYECIEDIWPDYPTKEDFFFNEEEY